MAIADGAATSIQVIFINTHRQIVRRIVDKYCAIISKTILCFVRYLKNTSSSLDPFCHFMAVQWQCQTRALVGSR